VNMLPMAESDHNALIRDVGRESLAPLGLVQKGRSRTWIDDHGWWLIVVGFEPSSWSKGTYCMIGFDHLWVGRDHLVFDEGRRIRVDRREFVSFDPSAPDRFKAQLAEMADTAAAGVADYRRRHGSGSLALRTLTRRRGDLYEDYSAGCAAGLLGRRRMAEQAFARVLTCADQRPWVARIKELASSLAALLDTPERFAAELTTRVRRTRDAVGLKDVPILWKET
jgi:hypothetical protein